MNRAIIRVLSSSSRILPRVYGSTAAPKGTSVGHHASGDAQHHHDHHHHHEPEKRKTQTWRHHSGMQSKYENQSEDHSMSFMAERANYYDYRPTVGQVPLSMPYRSHASLYEMWLYHAAMLFSIWLWWYIMWRFSKESSWFFGHAHYPDMSKFTNEELGVPPDDLD